MTGLSMKQGFLELIIPAALCGISWAIGLSWVTGLALAGGLLILVAFTACIVNFCCLQPDVRVNLLSCIMQPYSTLAVIIPYALIWPGLERMQSDVAAMAQATQSETELNNNRDFTGGSHD